MKKIIDNVKAGRFTKPIVIRMRGDDEEYAGLILKKYIDSLSEDSPIRNQIHVEKDFDNAAKLAVLVAKGNYTSDQFKL